MKLTKLIYQLCSIQWLGITCFSPIPPLREERAVGLVRFGIVSQSKYPHIKKIKKKIHILTN